jgi:hypothetical protein
MGPQMGAWYQDRLADWLSVIVWLLTWQKYMTPCEGGLEYLHRSPCESVRGKHLFRHVIQSTFLAFDGILISSSPFRFHKFCLPFLLMLFTILKQNVSFYNKCCTITGNYNTVNRLKFITIFWLHHRGDFYFDFIPAYPFVNPVHMPYLHAQFDSCPINIMGKYWNQVSEFCLGFSHLFIITKNRHHNLVACIPNTSNAHSTKNPFKQLKDSASRLNLSHKETSEHTLVSLPWSTCMAFWSEASLTYGTGIIRQPDHHTDHFIHPYTTIARQNTIYTVHFDNLLYLSSYCCLFLPMLSLNIK